MESRHLNIYYFNLTEQLSNNGLKQGIRVRVNTWCKAGPRQALHLLTDVRLVAGARHSDGRWLRGGPAPLGRLPGTQPAIHSLEEGLGHQNHQHGGVPAPEARAAPQGLHPQQHHGERGAGRRRGPARHF